MGKTTKSKVDEATPLVPLEGQNTAVSSYWGYIPWKDKLDEVLPQYLDQALKRLRGSNYDALLVVESDEVRIRALCALFEEANVEE